MNLFLDHLSDIIALSIEGVFVILTIWFMMRMKQSGAKVWQEMAEYLLMLSFNLILGQAFVFISVFFTEQAHLTLFLLIGNLFWVGAAAFGYLMVSNLSQRIGSMLT